LTTPLLADTERTVCAAYGVLKDDGRGVKRQTFIVDEQGRIEFHYEKVDAGAHPAEVLARFVG
jgi:peroxiredoxin